MVPQASLVSTGNESQVPNNLGDGLQVGASAASLVGFYGASPVVQPVSSGNTHTVTAGSTTSIFTNTTLDGGIGSTAYTVGDLVKALKQLGLIAS